MASLETYLDDLLACGRAYCSRDDVAAALGLKPAALAVAITRGINKRRLANPRHGFYLILRPEDQIAGARIRLRHDGDLHLMLIDLKAPLKAGDRLSIWLRFERAGEREVTVWVQQPRRGRAHESHKH